MKSIDPCRIEDEFELKETKDYYGTEISIYSSNQILFDKVPEKIKIVINNNSGRAYNYDLEFIDNTNATGGCPSRDECIHSFFEDGLL